MWDITFELVNDMTADPVVPLLVTTPSGKLTFTTEPVTRENTLVLRGTHVQDSRANAVGVGNLLNPAQALMERMGFDGLVVEGALRTTRANSGHRPRVFRFTRHIRPPPSAEPRDAQYD